MFATIKYWYIRYGHISILITLNELLYCSYSLKDILIFLCDFLAFIIGNLEKNLPLSNFNVLQIAKK